MYTYFFYNNCGDNMNKKYLDALVIILITVCVTAVVFMFLESKSSKNDKEISENNVSSDVSKVLVTP